MKQLTCEMCGGTDLIKQDGVFMCQNCGMKYSVEEAKRMMIEGTVEVQGTVKVDNSAFVERYLQNARRAKQKEDWEEVEKYYNMVEQNDPTNIEAIFYSAYGKARLSMVDNDVYRREQICDVFCNCISVIDDNYNVDKSEENREIILQMHYDLFNMYGTNFVYTETSRTQNGYTHVSDNRGTTYFMFAKMALAFIDSIENIIKADGQLIYWKMIYEHRKYLVGNTGLTVEARNKNREIALSIAEQIHKKDSSFEIEEIEEATSGGCYVATCVYGSYDCPQVWTLRRYRDYKLDATWYGRAFIKTYYAVSPTLVKWFGNTNWFKNLWKGTLDSMVAKLQEQGYENTRYNDKY